MMDCPKPRAKLLIAMKIQIGLNSLVRLVCFARGILVRELSDDAYPGLLRKALLSEIDTWPYDYRPSSKQDIVFICQTKLIETLVRSRWKRIARLAGILIIRLRENRLRRE